MGQAIIVTIVVVSIDLIEVFLHGGWRCKSMAELRIGAIKLTDCPDSFIVLIMSATIAVVIVAWLAFLVVIVTYTTAIIFTATTIIVFWCCKYCVYKNR